MTETLASLNKRLIAVERRLSPKPDTMDRAIVIRNQVLGAAGIALDDFLSTSRRGDLVAARVTIARLAYDAKCKRKDIAAVIGLSESQVTRARKEGLGR